MSDGLGMHWSMDLGWIGGGLVNGFGVDWGWIGVDWGGLALFPRPVVRAKRGELHKLRKSKTPGAGFLYNIKGQKDGCVTSTCDRSSRWSMPCTHVLLVLRILQKRWQMR